MNKSKRIRWIWASAVVVAAGLAGIAYTVIPMPQGVSRLVERWEDRDRISIRASNASLRVGGLAVVPEIQKVTDSTFDFPESTWVDFELRPLLARLIRSRQTEVELICDPDLTAWVYLPVLRTLQRAKRYDLTLKVTGRRPFDLHLHPRHPGSDNRLALSGEIDSSLVVLFSRRSIVLYTRRVELPRQYFEWRDRGQPLDSVIKRIQEIRKTDPRSTVRVYTNEAAGPPAFTLIAILQKMSNRLGPTLVSLNIHSWTVDSMVQMCGPTCSDPSCGEEADPWPYPPPTIAPHSPREIWRKSGGTRSSIGHQ